jgi:glycosyltransferase involved in cell wall biosynthesis
LSAAGLAGEHAFVIVAYGRSPFLEGCLATLAAQTLRSRVVVATSTPSPDIAAAAQRFGAELRVNPQAEGIGADWNFGLTATAARYVTLAHQDDTYRPAFLERTLELFARRPQGGVCFTGYDEVDDDGAVTASRISRVKHLIEAATLGAGEAFRGGRLKPFLAFGNPLPCSSVTFDRARLADFRFSLDHQSNLDWDAWWRLAEQGETFLRRRERLVGRRHNPLTATSALIASGRRRQEDLEMFRRIWPRPIADAVAWLYRAGY